MKRYLPLLGVALFLYIISRFDLAQIWGVLLSANSFYLLLALLMFPILIFFRGLKWKVILSFCGIDYPLRYTTTLWLMGMYMGAITPGRVGEFGRAYYLKKEGHPAGGAILSVVLDRLVDFIVLSLFGIFAIFSLFFYVGVDLTFLFVVLLVMFLGIYIFFEKDLMSTLSRPLFNRFVPQDQKNVVRTSFNDFYEKFYVIRVNRGRFLPVFLISFIMWLLYILQVYLLAISLDLGISYFYLLGVFPLSAIAATLPISISGLGTREAIYLYFLTKIGISPVQTVSLSLLVLAFSWIPSVFGLCSWLVYSKRV